MKWFKEVSTKLSKKTNQDGQPLIQNYRASAIGSRQVDELIGLIKGVLADGMVCQAEVEFLLKWMQSNQAVINEWPAKVLYPRITEALADGFLDEQEELEILQLLQAASGNDDALDQGWSSGSSSLPLCKPSPLVIAPDRIFCFTGKFNAGSRNWCHEQVTVRGGLAANNITKKLNYLVIGDIGSRDWLHSTHGTKILKAVEYRDSGVPLNIISERYWYEQLVESGK